MNKRLPEFEDCQEIERLTRADWLASEELIAYSSTKTKGILLKNRKDHREKHICGGGQNEGYPVFSPDGKYLLFLSMQSERFCILVYNRNTEEIRSVVQFAKPIIDPMWSPDGKHILFASVSEETPASADTFAEPILIEELGYKFDGVGFRKPNNTVQLFIADFFTGEVVRITEGACDFLHHNWCPDSRHIICISDKFRPGKEYLGYDLLRIDSETKKQMRLTQNLWLASYPSPVRPVCTPDGRFVIAAIMDSKYAKTISTGTFPETALYKIAMDGSGAEKIFIPDADCYQCTQFPYDVICGSGMDKLQLSEDGNYVFFHSGWQGQGGLFRLKINGDGHAVPLGRGKYVWHGISRIQDGKFLAARCSCDLPEGYYLVDAETGTVLEQLVQSAKDYLEETEISIPEDFSVTTLDGCDKIHGWVLPPQRREESKRYPAILYIHGGPHPFYSYAVMLEHQCFAARGFGVIYCNPRGSSGYGWRHQNMGDARGTEPYYDCLQFVDEAIRRCPWIDPQRLGVTGGSYGGYMTNYMAVHSKRFRAYITQRSVTNEQILYASSDETGCSSEFDSFPQFMKENLKKSVVSYAENIDRPFLILHGENDCRTPVEGARQLFSAIRDLHPELPVKLVLIPETGHSQPQEPTAQKQYYQEMADWFEKYL